MNKLAEPIAPAGPFFPRPKIDLIEEDNIPLETPWHHRAISLMIDVLTCLWRGLGDFFVGGDMFLYFSEKYARNRDFRGPDFFYVKGVDRFKERRWWATWEEEGPYPNFIMELLSESTAVIDRIVKKDLYEQIFRTPEYFCYDPDEQKLEAWRLDAQLRYQAIQPSDNGWLWSEQLNLWIGTWEGEYLGLRAIWLRFYDKNGNLLPTSAELEQQKAETERRRAEAAEAELARLRRLAEGKDGPEEG